MELLGQERETKGEKENNLLTYQESCALVALKYLRLYKVRSKVGFCSHLLVGASIKRCCG